ncbi:MAG: hypothetical protein SOZ59_05520 [Candidatus Limivivens sp.]|nr:hypothetical protein [Candidatus Limivivens sp.]
MAQVYTLTKREKETMILFNQSSDPVDISGYDRKLFSKLSLLAQQHPELCQRVDNGKHADFYQFRVAKQCLSLRFNRPMNDEKKAAARERAKAAGFGAPPEHDLQSKEHQPSAGWCLFLCWPAKIKFKEGLHERQDYHQCGIQ